MAVLTQNDCTNYELALPFQHFEYWSSHIRTAVFYGQLSATSIDNIRPVLMMRDLICGDNYYHKRQSCSAKVQCNAYKTAAENLLGLKDNFAVVCTYG